MDANIISTYIEAYYKTNQLHVAWSFWASLIALFVGLVVLIIGVALALNGNNTALSVTTAFSGVFTQFISVGFFFLYNKNLRQLNIFYQQLIQNHDIMLALGLTGHIPENLRPHVIQGVIGALLSRSAPSTELTADHIRALNESKTSIKSS